jgi:hypothetical protein
LRRVQVHSYDGGNKYSKYGVGEIKGEENGEIRR